jgi:hypothetical protein
MKHVSANDPLGSTVLIVDNGGELAHLPGVM